MIASAPLLFERDDQRGLGVLQSLQRSLIGFDRGGQSHNNLELYDLVGLRARLGRFLQTISRTGQNAFRDVMIGKSVDKIFHCSKGLHERLVAHSRSSALKLKEQFATRQCNDNRNPREKIQFPLGNKLESADL